MRVVGGWYEGHASARTVDAHAAAQSQSQAVLHRANQLPVDQLSVLLGSFQGLLADMTRSGFAQHGLPLDETELTQVVSTIKAAVLAAK
jgi:hypothetical protein